MTVNQVTVHPSTVSIPAPIYKLGQHVKWSNTVETASVHSLIGIVIEQVYRIHHDSSNWQYTVAITVAKVDGKNVDWYAGEYGYDLDECLLSAS